MLFAVFVVVADVVAKRCEVIGSGLDPDATDSGGVCPFEFI